MSKRITAAIVATLSVSVPAMAADIYVPTADPAPLISGVPYYDWSGFHVGLGGGTALSNNRVTTATAANSFGGIGGRGYFGELTVGYDYALANGVVLSGLVSGRLGDIDASWSGGAGAWSGTITSEYGIDVLGRVGYSILPRTLAYALAGYSWQHFKLSGTSPAVSTTWNESGYIVGFGTETAIHDNWTLSSEYRYANYGSEGIAAYGGSIDPVIHSFHTRLNYRLGGGPSGQTAAPVIYDWNGVKVGGALGLGVALNEVTGPAGFDSMSNEAFIAEANIGYDRVFGGHWLGGVVLAARYDGGRSALVYTGVGGTTKTESAGFDALVRAGRIFGDRTLGYVIGGYSWQKMTGTIAGTSNNTGVNGFTIGTGVEFAVSDNVTAYVETRYSGYEDYAVGAFNVDPSSHSVRVGAKWKLY